MANTVAAVPPAVRDHTGHRAARLRQLDRGRPGGALIRFLIFGVAEIGPVACEVPRRAEPDLGVPSGRPRRPIRG
ncbi:hypothetical protein [Catenuloplanes atrovinosus]|uniref:Uncharacterized protein n=1 Tax=Catenuloplanes atrovinosus TaxID=137266 RepID=A0AAE3YPA4_9ACTN|nr:hypothetical protein [Catenuloplanes atrovinosus]MDR7277508.1 hypothetical protein [Catenuloplanes atrovinosus]